MRWMKVAAIMGVGAAAVSAAAEEKRQLGAHEHGHSVLNIAVEGAETAMELIAPSADIVGFEYEPESDADRAAVEQALADLKNPMTLFGPNAEAECALVEAKVERVALSEGAEDHDDHGHDDHAQDDHGHDDHGHDDHAHEEHGEDHAKHEDEHAEHDDHAHDKEHGHDDHADHHDDHGEAAHSEFRATYRMTCGAPEKLANLVVGFFDRFENSEELSVTVVSAKGQQRLEAERGDTTLDLSGAL